MEGGTRDDLMDRLMATFAAEAEERVQAMNRDTLVLEATSDRVAIERILEGLLREVHSLKGAARAVEVQRVELLAHRLESLFELMLTGVLAPEPAVCDVILRALDAIGALVREATAGEPANVDLAEITALLDDPRRGVAAALSVPPRPQPPPEPRPSDTRATAGTQPGRTARDTVRVSVAKLDALLAAVGELVVAHTATEQHLGEMRILADELKTWEARWRKRRSTWRGAVGRRAARRDRPAVSPGLDEADWQRLRDTRSRVVVLHRMLRASARRVAQLTGELDDEVRRSRMLPVATVLDAFPRMVRDLSREQGKEVALVVEGTETEVDRALLEELRSPLTHIVRNSIDHGLEAPGVRAGAGKPRQGTITVRVHAYGGSLGVEVIDDGAGMDRTALRERAVEQGLVSAEEADLLTDREAIGLIFRSGFTTAPILTDVSGRGVGMDVVRDSIERMHGVIDVESERGSGTRFSLRIPLSVATTPCLLVGTHGHVFALPIANVARIVSVAPGAVEYIEGRPVIVVDDGGFVPLAGLASVLAISDPGPTLTDEPRPALVLGSGEQRTAFLVDALVDLQSLVTKALPAPFVRVRHISGAAILGTGEVVTILNVPDLVRTVSPVHAAEEIVQRPPRRSASVLLAEDSPTTRALQKTMLEGAGHTVRAVGDGAEAWALLQEGNFDIVVTDIRMPGLDGFELTGRIRADERLQRLPVVLVTSTDTRSHRDRGVEVGANAYIVKGTLEQERLIDTVERFL